MTIEDEVDEILADAEHKYAKANYEEQWPILAAHIHDVLRESLGHDPSIEETVVCTLTQLHHLVGVESLAIVGILFAARYPMYADQINDWALAAEEPDAPDLAYLLCSILPEL
mgnify:CR=1 FL=1